MNPQNSSNTLNALGNLDAASAEVSPSGWAALAKAVGRVAPDMTEQSVVLTLITLIKLDAASAERLEAAAEREAPEMNSVARRSTLRACEKLNLKIPSALI